MNENTLKVDEIFCPGKSKIIKNFMTMFKERGYVSRGECGQFWASLLDVEYIPRYGDDFLGYSYELFIKDNN